MISTLNMSVLQKDSDRREAVPVSRPTNAIIPEGLAIMAIYFSVTAILGPLLFERKGFN